MITHRVAIAFLLVVSAAGLGQAQETRKADPLTPFAALEGTWHGEGEGFGQKSKVTHEWKRVLGGKFLRLTTRSVSVGRDGKESVHEDVGYLSWSREEKTARFRQFVSEGFVNTFQLKEVKGKERGFNFEPESTEGYSKMAARMTLRFNKEGGYEMVLELGSKGKTLKPCQTCNVKKVVRKSAK